ncbi:hypothetical protein CERSUDRAFT_81791 [Gelatoporia subvermispora B]|uniref:DUF590-domain-containing protein n=1 Tax=Ceriporiopsis subvermispora (strain B) TaxID=914234 RepID=M2RKM0_CERS8|nr:hypothetical protein CERSUDRAFT_81791 [Gelatoporia subvermispora B]
MAPQADLVLVFRSSPGKVLSKPQARENARQATQQYTRLLDVLKQGGLRAVGKRGERDGQLLVLVSCPRNTLVRIAQRERHSDFLCGLPTTNPIDARNLDEVPLAPADHLRLIYSYMTSTTSDGGLGVAPGSPEWNRVESVMVLHDHAFNETWIRSWTTHSVNSAQFTKLRDQFGEAVALYFSFLAFYTRFLLFISLVGAGFYFLAAPYSMLYSSVLVLWTTAFVEWWRIKQRVLAVRWGTRGVFRVEKRRAQYVHLPWWQRDLRLLASLPVILLFAALLAVLMTGIFFFEAFVTQLYTGPGHRFISFSPTILFVLLVPRLMKLYHAYALALTRWENHAHQSRHDASLTLKTFSLSAIVSYLGLALSAFVYVPFGEEVMTAVQGALFQHGQPTARTPRWVVTLLIPFLNATSWVAEGVNGTLFNKSESAVPAGSTASSASAKPKGARLWEMDSMSARSKLSPTRLQDQMFALTVTNQVVNTFLEVGLPFILRAVTSFQRGKGLSLAAPAAGAAKKKRVSFEDQPGEGKGAGHAHSGEEDEKEEREFLERVRREVALPEYDLFEDYSEMVTQLGYVALWSTIWPLAPVMSLINNWFELRSDAFKIAVHTRRPLPMRTDTIGPWLDSLTFLSWLAFLTNSALVYLFKPRDHCTPLGTSLSHRHHHLSTPSARPQEILRAALLVALAASHGYFIVRAIVRHVLERALWRGSEEEREAERAEAVVKQEYLKGLGVADVVGNVPRATKTEEPMDAFWMRDEGLDELSRTKDS